MTSANPLVEAFTKWSNLKIVLISLFGATAGQGVVWYTGQFYVLFYLQKILNVDATLVNYIIASALLLGMPLFVVFGALSDRIGRKWIIMAGCLLAVLTYLPIYHAMQSAAGSNIETATSQTNPATGEKSLTPLTRNSEGTLVPAPKVLVYSSFGSLISNSTAWKLILLVLLQVVWVTIGLRPHRGLSGRGVSRQETLIQRCRCRIISATAFSAACCR